MQNATPGIILQPNCRLEKHKLIPEIEILQKEDVSVSRSILEINKIA